MTNKRSEQTQRVSGRSSGEAAHNKARRQFLQAVNTALRAHTDEGLRLRLCEGQVGVYRHQKKLDIYPGARLQSSGKPAYDTATRATASFGSASGARMEPAAETAAPQRPMGQHARDQVAETDRMSTAETAQTAQTAQTQADALILRLDLPAGKASDGQRPLIDNASRGEWIGA